MTWKSCSREDTAGWQRKVGTWKGDDIRKLPFGIRKRKGLNLVLCVSGVEVQRLGGCE